MIRKADDKTPKLGSDGTLLSWPQVRVVLGEPDAQLLASSAPRDANQCISRRTGDGPTLLSIARSQLWALYCLVYF